jgi:signal transduction histidine kinase
LAAVLGGLFLLDSVRTTAQRDAPNRVVDLVVGAVACGALLLRRRWTVALAVVLIPSIVVSTSAMGATAVAVAAVAVYRSWPVTAAVLSAHAATVATLFALVAPDAAEFWTGLIVLLAMDAALVASGLLVRSQRLLVQSLRERAHEAEEGHRLRMEQARRAERERIAREMHDVLAHRLSLLAVHAGALEVRRSATPQERHATGVVRTCAYEALEDLREVIGMLRDGIGSADVDRPQPTLTDIPSLVEQSRVTGMPVILDMSVADLPVVPDGIGRHAYRIVQEGLTNARKHAPGEQVRVRLAGPRDGEVAGDVVGRGGAGAGLIVEVSNALAGGVVATMLPGAGSGLVGLAERVHLVGGRLEHGATGDGRFRLRAWLPWRP